MKSVKASFIVLVLDCFITPPAYAFRRALQPRDDASSNDTIPAPLIVTPSQSWDGNDGPWSSFALQIGPGNAQSVSVFPSSKSSVFWTILTLGCPDNWFPNRTDDCFKSRGGVYNPNASATWISQGIYELHIDKNLGSGTGVDIASYSDANGQYGYDTVIPGFKGSNSAVPHQVIAGIATTSWWLGVMPLNPRPFNFSNLPTPQISFLSQLRALNEIPSKTWAYTAGAKYRYNGIFGSLTFGGYDTGRFAGSGANITIPMGMEQETDLIVGVQRITASTSSGATSLLPETSGIYAVIDTTVPEIYLPQDACNAFATNFDLEWNSTVGTYLVEDNQYENLLSKNATISFQLGASAAPSNDSITIDVPIAALLQTLSFPRLGQDAGNQTSYYFPLKPAESTQPTTFTLGRAFLQEAYVIADYERNNFMVAPCIWPGSNPSETIIPILTPSDSPTTSSFSFSSSSSIGAGAIAGIVIGATAALLVVAFLIICLRRRRATKKRAEQFHGISGPSSSHTNRPSITARLRGWSWSRLPGSPTTPGNQSSAPPGAGFELSEKPAERTPGEAVIAAYEAQRKRTLSEELDSAGLFEMYAGRKDPVEMEGNGFGNRYGPPEVNGDGRRNEVHEMEGSVISSQTGTPLPSPPLTSPSQLDAFARQERDTFERNIANNPSAYLTQHGRSQSDSSIETVGISPVRSSLGIHPRTQSETGTGTLPSSGMHSRSQSETGTGTLTSLDGIREERESPGSGRGGGSG